MFAKPAPSTMTKEYQEASNEYLRVRSSQLPLMLCNGWHRLLIESCTGAKLRAPYRCLCCQLQGQGYGSVSSGSEISSSLAFLRVSWLWLPLLRLPLLASTLLLMIYQTNQQTYYNPPKNNERRDPPNYYFPLSIRKRRKFGKARRRWLGTSMYKQLRSTHQLLRNWGAGCVAWLFSVVVGNLIFFLVKWWQIYPFWREVSLRGRQQDKEVVVERRCKYVHKEEFSMLLFPIRFMCLLLSCRPNASAESVFITDSAGLVPATWKLLRRVSRFVGIHQRMATT